MLQFECAGLR